MTYFDTPAEIINDYDAEVILSHLDAALACMNTLGRVAVCGMISGYNEPGARTVVRNLANILVFAPADRRGGPPERER
jgi:NADPH-dependent curcumin reductase CurA